LLTANQLTLAEPGADAAQLMAAAATLALLVGGLFDGRRAAAFGFSGELYIRPRPDGFQGGNWPAYRARPGAEAPGRACRPGKCFSQSLRDPDSGAKHEPRDRYPGGGYGVNSFRDEALLFPGPPRHSWRSLSVLQPQDFSG
jgi:hypothetical protein